MWRLGKRDEDEDTREGYEKGRRGEEGEFAWVDPSL